MANYRCPCDWPSDTAEGNAAHQKECDVAKTYAERDRWMESAKVYAQNVDFWRGKAEAMELQNERLQNALKHIIGFYGPGLDGSPEEVAGKLAREALEAEGVKDFALKRFCEAERFAEDRKCGEPLPCKYHKGPCEGCGKPMHYGGPGQSCGMPWPG